MDVHKRKTKEPHSSASGTIVEDTAYKVVSVEESAGGQYGRANGEGRFATASAVGKPRTNRAWSGDMGALDIGARGEEGARSLSNINDADNGPE